MDNFTYFHGETGAVGAVWRSGFLLTCSRAVAFCSRIAAQCLLAPALRHSGFASGLPSLNGTTAYLPVHCSVPITRAPARVLVFRFFSSLIELLGEHRVLVAMVFLALPGERRVLVAAILFWWR